MASQGGAFYIADHSKLILSTYVVSGNQAPAGGGAGYIGEDALVELHCESKVTLITALTPLPNSTCIFGNNSATTADGGALYLSGRFSILTVAGDAAFFNNSAARNGGGIFSVNAAPVSQVGDGRLSFFGNRAGIDTSSGGGSGGAVYLSISSDGVPVNRTLFLELSDASFDGNSCSQRGGAILVDLPVGKR